MVLNLLCILIACFISGANGAENVFDRIFPIVGSPVGTAYPYEVDIARDPMDVPKEALPDGAHITITSVEIETYLSPANNGAQWRGDGSDVKFLYMLFGGGHDPDAPPKVPGPFIRTKEGRTLTVLLDNSSGESTHSIDFHAVLGWKGGGSVLMAAPGETASLTFTLKNAGVYIYHCVGSGNVFSLVQHVNNGMFGIILVEPREGVVNEFTQMTRDATEFYVVQQDIFLGPNENFDGVMGFDEPKMLSPNAADYSVFNGRIGAVLDKPMYAVTGKNAVLYFGTAGDHISSPHMIGEVFDYVFIQGSIMSPPLKNIQSTILPTSATAVMVMRGDMLIPSDLSQGLGPQLNIFVDHASSYMRKGAFGIMLVEEAPLLCSGTLDPSSCSEAMCEHDQYVNGQWTIGRCISVDEKCTCAYNSAECGENQNLITDEDEADVKEGQEIRRLLWEVMSDGYEDIHLQRGGALEFSYLKSHNVWLMDDLEAYQNCDFDRGVELAGNNASPYTHIFSQPGDYYFTCEEGDHCLAGQAVIVHCFE